MGDWLLSGELATKDHAEHLADWVFCQKMEKMDESAWLLRGCESVPEKALEFCRERRLDFNPFDLQMVDAVVFDSGVVMSCFDDDFGLWNKIGLKLVVAHCKASGVSAFGVGCGLDDPKKLEGLGLVDLERNTCPAGKSILITSADNGVPGFLATFVFRRARDCSAPLFFSNSSLAVARCFFK